MRVFIVGDIKDNEINKLIDKISNSYTNTVLKKNTFNKNYKPSSFELKKSHTNHHLIIRNISFEDNTTTLSGIVIFKNSFNQHYNIKIAENSICILEPSNKHAIKTLSSSKASVITCGTSPRDTLSLASLTPGKAVVSIQRNIIALNNKIIDSRDVVIKLLENYKTYSILSVCAFINLIGINQKSQNEYIF